MDDRTSLTVNSLARLVMNGISKFVTLLIVIIASRRLGPEGLGIMTFFISSGLLASTFLSLGIPHFLNYILGVEKRGRWFWGALRISLPLLLLLVASLPLGLAPFVALALPLMLQEVVTASFSGLESQLSSLPRGVAREATRLIVAITIILLTGRGELAPLAYMAGAAVYVLLSLDFFLHLPDPSPAPLREIISRSLPFFFVGVTAAMLGHTDAIMLYLLKGERELGLYRAATSFVYGFLGLLPFMTATFPIIGRRIGRGGPWILRKIVLPILLISLVFQLLVYLSSFLFGFIYGEKFLEALPTLFLFSCIIPLSTLYQLGQQTLLAMGRNKEQVIFNVSALFLNILLNIVLIPVAGRDGAVASSILSLLAASLLTWRHALTSF